MSSTSRNQLKSQNLGDVIPSAFLQVGQSIYPDAQAIQDLKNFQTIVDDWRAVHLPTFGHPIPQTGFTGQTTLTSVTTKELLTPTGNKVVLVQGISVESTEDNRVAYFGLCQTGDTSIISRIFELSLKAGDHLYAPYSLSLRIPSGQSLVIETVASGSVGMKANVSFVSIVQ